MRVIFILIMMFFISGCQNELLLKNSVTYELGEDISYDLNDYLKEESDIKDYELNLVHDINGCGTYTMKISHQNKEYYCNILIKDTTAPTIVMDEKISIYVNDTIKYEDYFDIQDLSNFDYCINDEKVNYKKKGVYKASLQVTDAFFNTAIKEFEVIVKEKEVVKKTSNETNKTNKSVYYIDIDTYIQGDYGYKRGCEGVSLYMALKGKGYIKDLDIHEFMDTMPLSSENPQYGYVGDPTKSKNSIENKGKRTTIYPEALAKWGNQYGNVESLQGKDVDVLKKEIKKGNVLIVYMTSSYKDAIWEDFSFGKAVTNNHALCLVGYDENSGEYIVNDCGKKGGVYRVKKKVFEKSYRERYFAVVVR